MSTHPLERPARETQGRVGRRLAWRFALPLAVVAGMIMTTGAVSASPPPAQPDFGPNVVILDPSMSTSQIKTIVDGISTQQIPSQFGTGRYEILFKPGTYGADTPLNLRIGYYTDVAGLGALPTDVAIRGTIDAYNQCFSDGCTALVNFWRSISNLTINVAGKSGCQVGEFWATSQATSLRRVNVNGNATLMDYCSGPSYASGGFIADSRFSRSVTNGSQQQYFVRNSSIGGWSNAVWNQVFAGVQGAPAQSFPNPPYTTLATNPASREKPYLYIDGSGNYNVFVPDAQTNSRGTTWTNGQTPGHSISLAEFFLATPSDSVHTINYQLAQGKNLMFTPGVYDVDQSIRVKRADTIVLGLGIATLTACLLYTSPSPR